MIATPQERVVASTSLAMTAIELHTKAACRAVVVAALNPVRSNVVGAAAEDRAVEVLTLLADRGHHREPSVPDLLVAAIAERAGLVVLHQDKDFDLIAQQIERLNG